MGQSLEMRLAPLSGHRWITLYLIRTVAITDAHATPNTSIVAGRSIAVCPSITGTIKRNGGNAFSVITGFSDGLRAQAFGNFGGSGAWSWDTSLTPRLDYQVYIETAYMD